MEKRQPAQLHTPVRLQLRTQRRAASIAGTRSPSASPVQAAAFSAATRGFEPRWGHAPLHHHLAWLLCWQEPPGFHPGFEARVQVPSTSPSPVRRRRRGASRATSSLGQSAALIRRRYEVQILGRALGLGDQPVTCMVPERDMVSGQIVSLVIAGSNPVGHPKRANRTGVPGLIAIECGPARGWVSSTPFSAPKCWAHPARRSADRVRLARAGVRNCHPAKKG